MHFGCVDFPKDLVDARTAGKLVVFAGAGVSIPPPSGLPDFPKLALELAQGERTLEKKEPLDRFLGRLPEGLRIHERTRDRLCGPDSKPNPLHFNLLKLFAGASTVRLVTTNFDLHFSTAARDLWKTESTEVFAAPALPKGGHFEGLVHLHGSVTGHPKRMVLTDGDFGKAYLTEGWARRFLLDMFLSDYTVLFVGYSHNDPVMHYLARGLPTSTEGKRFALTPEGKGTFWEHLGIAALMYPVRRGRNSHQELGTALEKWAAFAAERPLDKCSRIREIVSKPPPDAGQDHDYLIAALNDESTTRFFTEHAKRFEWFAWVRERDTFLRLFRQTGDRKPTDWPLALWFAEEFALDHGGVVLEWIARNKLTLGPVCMQELTRTISRRMQSGGACPALDKWVPFLVQSQPACDKNDLSAILFRCSRFPEDANVSFLLFEYLLRPKAELKPDDLKKAVHPDSEPDVDLELGTVGNSGSTRKAWQQYFQPRLEIFAGRLATIAAAHLEQARLLSCAFGHSYDVVSNAFSDLAAMNCSEGKGLGVLVAVARDTLLWLARNDRARADGLIELWWNAGSNVLQRLSVFGIAQSPAWTADEKLKWLLDRDLFYHQGGFDQERWALLNVEFRNASPEMKNRVVDATLAIPMDRGEYANEYYRKGLRGRLLQLKLADPDCDRVAEELSTIPESEEHVRESELLPAVPETLLSRSPADAVGELLSLEMTFTERRIPHVLFRAVQNAATENPDWGLELADALRLLNKWDTGFWQSIAVGWIKATLSSDQMVKVLNLLADCPQITSAAVYEAVEVLERRTTGDSNPFKGPLFRLAVKAGLQVWKVLEARESSRRDDAKDWLAVAINDSGGRLAQFFVRMLWQAKKESGADWRGLTGDLRLYMDRVIQGKSWESEMARVVLATHVETLFCCDAEWTRDNVIGLFNWSAHPRSAQQAWRGYLTWGKWSDDLLEVFLPQCRETFARGESLGDRAAQFCDLLASIAVYAAVDPMKSGWLQEFVRNARPVDRLTWSSAVRLSLENYPAGKRRHVWARWMRTYWEFRLRSLPELEAGEVPSMVEWSAELEDAFPEAVELILKGPAAQTGEQPCLRLYESGVWRTYPQESARLLRFLARSQRELPSSDCIVELVKELARLRGKTEVLVDICQELAALGYQQAEELKNYVVGQASPPGS